MNSQSNSSVLAILQNAIAHDVHYTFLNSCDSTCAIYKAKTYNIDDAIAKVDQLNGNTNLSEKFADEMELFEENEMFVIAQILTLSDEDSVQGFHVGEWIFYNEDSIM